MWLPLMFRYQQLLHKNLVYLATLADPHLNLQAILPVCTLYMYIVYMPISLCLLGTWVVVCAVHLDTCAKGVVVYPAWYVGRKCILQVSSLFAVLAIWVSSCICVATRFGVVYSDIMGCVITHVQPPNSSNLIQSQRATPHSQQQLQTSTPSLPSNSMLSQSVAPPSTTTLQHHQQHQQMQQAQLHQSQVAMTSIGSTTSHQPWSSAVSMPSSMAAMTGAGGMPPSHMMSGGVMVQGGQYGMSNSSPWSQGGASYPMQQRMPGGGVNPMVLEEQRRQLRMRQKQFIQMQQRRLQQQQQQQSMAGSVMPSGMGGMYGPPPGAPHAGPGSGVMPPGMPPSYGQLTSMGGGMPPHSLAQVMPGGPGPMTM